MTDQTRTYGYISLDEARAKMFPILLERMADLCVDLRQMADRRDDEGKLDSNNQFVLGSHSGTAFAYRLAADELERIVTRAVANVLQRVGEL